MLSDEEIEAVREVIDACRSGHLDIQRDADKIAKAVAITHEHSDDPGLCSVTVPTALKPKDAVAFVYHRPDVNDPWRFGVVDRFNAGCWIIFTFNLKKKRDKQKNKIVPDGPGFRQYDLSKMDEVRLVCRPAKKRKDLADDPVFTEIGHELVKMLNKLKIISPHET